VSGASSPEAPLTERDHPPPSDVYAQSKWAAEQALIAAADGTAMDWTIMRPPLVYGPQAPGNFGRLARLVTSGLPLPFGAALAPRSIIGIDNFCAAIRAVYADPRAARETFLIADEPAVSVRDLVAAMAAAAGRPLRLISVPPSVVLALAALAGARHPVSRLFEPCVLNTSHISRTLGWHPPNSLAIGLRRAMSDDL
jgi:nucleoside-diphosphate-sugar epimerase